MMALPLPVTGSRICSVAAVQRFHHAVVGDDGARFERERAAGVVGLDRAVRLVDQRQSTVAGADLAGAGNGVVDVRQRVVRTRANDAFAELSDSVSWPPPSSVTPSPII